VFGIGLLLSPSIFAAGGAAGADAIRFGVSLGLTGKHAEPAEMQWRGYELWRDDVNRRGGILGQPVEITIVDDQSDPEWAKEIYRDLIATRKVNLLFGPYSSEIADAIAPIVDENGYPTLLAGGASDKIWQQGYRNVFGVLVPASRHALEMLSLAVVHGLRRVAVVHADDTFSTDVGNGAARWAHAAGLNVVLSLKFEKGTRDLRYIAAKAKVAGAELVVVGGHFDEAVDMRRALAKLGWYPRAYFATIGPTLQAYADILKADAELTFAPSLWEPSLSLEFPGSREFIEAFGNAYRVLPSYHAANAFAAGQVIEAAIGAAGTVERDRVRAALLALDVHVATGRFRVDRYGVPIKHPSLVIQWLGGKRAIVWPEEHRMDIPIFA